MGATRLVIPEIDSSEGYEEPINPSEDGLASAGFYPQVSATTDLNTGIERDANGNLVLFDPANGRKTLTEVTSGFDSQKLVIEMNGMPVYIGDGEWVFLS